MGVALAGLQAPVYWDLFISSAIIKDLLKKMGINKKR